MNKAQLLARCSELGIDTQDLNTNAKLKEAIQAKEAQIAALVEVTAPVTVTASEEVEIISEEVVVAAAEVTKAKKKKKPAVYTDDRGRKWAFKKSAPKTLNIDGTSMSQEDILLTEEVISELVYGNCGHLTQIV